jgi:hypothetical protein
MNSTPTQKSRILEAACRTDFLTFFQALFPILNPGVPLQTNWHLEAMAYHLELVLRGVIKRLIIAAPPRSLKSLMASVAFPAFALGRNPAARIIGISHNTDLQVRFHNECRLLIKNPRYQWLFPRLELLKNTETEFHSTMGGYRYAARTCRSRTVARPLLAASPRPRDKIESAEASETAGTAGRAAAGIIQEPAPVKVPMQRPASPARRTIAGAATKRR